MSQSLIVYHREGCHLCEDFIEILKEFISHYNDQQLLIELIDIDEPGNEQLKERFNVDVPVLELNNKIICCHFFDQQGLIDTLNYGSS